MIANCATSKSEKIKYFIASDFEFLSLFSVDVCPFFFFEKRKKSRKKRIVANGSVNEKRYREGKETTFEPSNILLILEMFWFSKEKHLSFFRAKDSKHFALGFHNRMKPGKLCLISRF